MGCKEYSGVLGMDWGFFLLFGWLLGEERVRSATSNSSPSMKSCVNFL